MVVDVHDEAVGTRRDQAAGGPLQHGNARDRHQGLRDPVREGAEPGAEAGGENESVHVQPVSISPFSGSMPQRSCSRCARWTPTPGNRSRMWVARRSAKYTLRCCPPVQPKATERLVKLRFR